MTLADGGPNRLDGVLAGLPHGEPDRGRADRTRARAHAVLSRRERRRRLSVVVAYRRHQAFVEFALAGACGLFYLSDVIRRAMRFYGL